MGDKSSIEWTEATWNPVVGCSKVSPGCANCYAEELHRTRLDGVGVYPPYLPWTPANAAHNVTLAPDRLDQPLRWRRPRMIFVNSMSDLFHELIPLDYLAQVWDVMVRCPQHTFQVLTKRPERIAQALGPEGTGFYAVEGPVPCPQPNVWLGTSIENRRYVGRADHLRAAPAAVRFISAEPLLGPLVHEEGCLDDDGRSYWYDGYRGPELDLDSIDWLIVGGESGRTRPERLLTANGQPKPVALAWVRDLRDACLREAERRPWPGDGGITGPAFFFKQWGGRTPKAGGRLLDGQEWNEVPSRAAERIEV